MRGWSRWMAFTSPSLGWPRWAASTAKAPSTHSTAQAFSHWSAGCATRTGGPCGKLRALLDEVCYCDPGEKHRLGNLIARHRRYGRSEDEARRWAPGPDQRNAELIAATRPFAHLIAELSGNSPPPRSPETIPGVSS